MFNPRARQVLQHPDCVEVLFHADGTPRVEPVSSKSKCASPTYVLDDSDDGGSPPADDAGHSETPDASLPIEREGGATPAKAGSKPSDEASEQVELPKEDENDTPAAADGTADPSAKTAAKKTTAAASGCSLVAGQTGDPGAPLLAIAGVALLGAAKRRRTRCAG
jgi:hypothetical protein